MHESHQSVICWRTNWTHKIHAFSLAHRVHRSEFSCDHRAVKHLRFLSVKPNVHPLSLFPFSQKVSKHPRLQTRDRLLY